MKCQGICLAVGGSYEGNQLMWLERIACCGSEGEFGPSGIGILNIVCRELLSCVLGLELDGYCCQRGLNFVSVGYTGADDVEYPALSRKTNFELAVISANRITKRALFISRNL